VHAVVVRRAAVKYVRERDVATSSRLILGVPDANTEDANTEVASASCRVCFVERTVWSVGVTEIISRDTEVCVSVYTALAPGCIHCIHSTRTALLPWREAHLGGDRRRSSLMLIIGGAARAQEWAR
jgi:hypothetical protein